MKDLRDLEIGVALSGGGFRATLHGLGVLMFLVDSGLNRQVNSIASVSGGSVANGCVAARCVFREVTPNEFDGIVGEIARAIVHRGLIPSLPFYSFMLVVLMLAAMSLVALAGTWLDYGPRRWSVLAFLCCVLLLFILWSLRGNLLSYLLRQRLLAGSKGKLGDLHHLNIEHVFCATDINHGAPVFLSDYGGGKIYSDSHGWGRAGHIRVCDAVLASASYPGAFPPFRLPTGRCDFGGPAHERSGVPRGKSLYLADGGVWNNLATDWWDLSTNRYSHGGPSRHSTFDHSMETLIEEKEGSRVVRAESTRTNRADVVLVVNSQASSFFLTPTLWLRIPFLAEIFGLMRDTQTMYENSVAPRLDALAELEVSALLDENRLPVLRVGDTVPPSIPIVIELNRNYKWGQTFSSRLEELRWLKERQLAFKNYNAGSWWESQ
jgi:predicted acylesterase/phospholipase RssA